MPDQASVQCMLRSEAGCAITVWNAVDARKSLHRYQGPGCKGNRLLRRLPRLNARVHHFRLFNMPSSELRHRSTGQFDDTLLLPEVYLQSSVNVHLCDRSTLAEYAQHMHYRRRGQQMMRKLSDRAAVQIIGPTWRHCRVVGVWTGGGSLARRQLSTLLLVSDL